MPERRLRIGVVYGGRSAEHSVSVESARALIENLDPAKYDVVPIGVDTRGRWRVGTSPAALLSGERAPTPETVRTRTEDGGTGPADALASPAGGNVVERTEEHVLGERFPASSMGTPVDVVFPLIHGTFGEDGTLQGLLEMADVPFVGAGVLGSALCMDKWAQKMAAQGAGIPTVPYLGIRAHTYRADPARFHARVAEKLGFPVFVKPSNSGSSRGISKVKAVSGLGQAMDEAFGHDGRVVVEKGLDCREIEVAVLGNEDPRVSCVGEILPNKEWYDFEAKYSEGGMRLEVPADLPEDLARRVQDLAREAFELFDCAGLSRIDFFLEREGDRLYLNEINTIPGFTAMSVYSKLWAASGLSYANLVDELIELALDRSRRRRFVFDSQAEG